MSSETLRGSTRSLKKQMKKIAAASPNGTPMKNTDRQDQVIVSHAPRPGPTSDAIAPERAEDALDLAPARGGGTGRRSP